MYQEGHNRKWEGAKRQQRQQKPKNSWEHKTF